jgi:hypothetical protein
MDYEVSDSYLKSTNEFNNGKINYCSRCKMKQADFICNPCDPFRYFCANCDGYVHSLPSKRTHSRVLIDHTNHTSTSQLNSLDSYGYDSKKREVDNNPSLNSNQNQRSTYQIKTQTLSNSNNDLSYLHSKTNNSFANEYIRNTNSPRNPNAINYINEIKQIYDTEKEDLINKTFSLEKHLDNVKTSMNERISTLHTQIDEMRRKHDLDIKILQDEHNMEIKRLSTDRENEFRMLQSNNIELQKCNDELLHKSNEYLRMIKDSRSDYTDKMSMTEFEIKRMEKELLDLKSYYEKRLSYITENFSEEKSKLINSYEKNIEKLNLGYKESKDKFINLLSQRDNDIQDLIAHHKREEK